MSVLIKGMEMPSRCNMCQLRDLCYDYYICRAKKLNDGRYLDVDDVKYKRHIKCPLVEVPTPHGRLIDADILLDAIRYGAEVRDFCNKKCKSQDCQNCVIKAVYKIIREVPIIIEA